MRWKRTSAGLAVTPSDVRAKASAVQRGEMTDEHFLDWVHEAVGHDGFPEYQGLVEMACVPALRDAGAGCWYAESEEARPLRQWVGESIARLSEGKPLEALPRGWAENILD